MNTGHQGTPPTGPDFLNMKSRIVYFLMMQGLGVVVLSAWLYLSYQDSKEQRTQNAACNQHIIEIYQAQNQQLIDILAEIRDYIKPNQRIEPVKTRRK
jgi:hypothetical protein